MAARNRAAGLTMGNPSAMKPSVARFLPHFVAKRLEGRQNLKEIIGNAGWLFADKIVRMGVGLLVNVWVARYLGPEQFGIFNYALAFVALFSALATLGLDNIVVRDIVREPDCRDETLGTAFLLKLAGGAVTLAATLATISLMRPADSLTHWLVGITAAGTIFQAFDAIDFWFQAQVRSKYTVYAKNAAFLMIAVVKVMLIMGKAPLVAFAWAGLAEIAVGAAGLAIAYRVNGRHLTAWRSTWSRAASLMQDSWPLIFSGIVTMIYLRIDQVMLREMVGPEEVGIYSAAVRLAEVWYFIPMALSLSVVPDIVRARAANEEVFYGKLQKYYNVMAFIAYAVAVPMTFLSGWLVNLLFGHAYSRAGSMLAVLVWGVMFVGLGIARSAFLTTMNWTRVHFFTVFLGAVVNVLLNLVLIPRYGGMGAVIASCVAYWMAAHGSCYLYRPLFRTGNMLTRAMIYPRFW